MTWKQKIAGCWADLERQWLAKGNPRDFLPLLEIGFYAGVVAAASLVASGRKIVEAVKPLAAAALERANLSGEPNEPNEQ